MHPIRGISARSSHQPDRPVSCSRRAPTASPGSSTASDRRTPTTPVPARIASVPRIASIAAATKEAATTASAQYQYSEREARPENVAYFDRQMLIASSKLRGGAGPLAESEGDAVAVEAAGRRPRCCERGGGGGRVGSSITVLSTRRRRRRRPESWASLDAGSGGDRRLLHESGPWVVVTIRYVEFRFLPVARLKH